MALTPAEKQKRYRERHKVLAQTDPRAIERALLQDVERCERGEMSDQERIALAERLADMAMDRRSRYERAATIHSNGSARGRGRRVPRWPPEVVVGSLNHSLYLSPTSGSFRLPKGYREIFGFGSHQLSD